MKNNGDIVQFIKQRDYVMVNNALGGGSFGKAVLLQDPLLTNLLSQRNMNRIPMIYR
jgi:serine/threonine-protein kinase